jgi:hypothetical protein
MVACYSRYRLAVCIHDPLYEPASSIIRGIGDTAHTTTHLNYRISGNGETDGREEHTLLRHRSHDVIACRQVNRDNTIAIRHGRAYTIHGENNASYGDVLGIYEGEGDLVRALRNRRRYQPADMEDICRSSK